MTRAARAFGLASVFVLMGALDLQPARAGSRSEDGLREALRVGAGNAVDLTGKLDGYFKNAAIKILMPSELKSLEKTARALGQSKKIDEFVLSMNRAAEKAAPEAREIFQDAIRNLTFQDVRKILTGGDTAATTFLRERTGASLAETFKPIVTRSLDDVGATRRYKDLVGKNQAVTLLGGGKKLDLDQYVTERALDGLFKVLGDEERKIRREPAARITSLLKEVFGR